MDVISSDVVEEVWKEHTEKSFFDIEKEIAQLSKEQPALLNYLTSTNAEAYNTEEQQLVLYLGVATWKMMKRGSGKMKKITSNDIAKAKEKNLQLISYLENELSGDFQSIVETVFNEYHQNNILNLLRKAIFSTDEKKTKIRSKNKGLMLFDLKTFLDCLDKE